MHAQTVEFTPVPAHPWTQVVSDVVSSTILGLPTEISWDAAAMHDYLAPDTYIYHGMVEGDQLVAFGALQRLSVAPTPEPGLHMNLVYLATTLKTGTRAETIPEMLRRLEGAAMYIGAVILHVYPIQGEADFYREQGYVWRYGQSQTGELYKPLKPLTN